MDGQAPGTSAHNKSCVRVKMALFVISLFCVMLLPSGLMLVHFLYKTSSAEEKEPDLTKCRMTVQGTEYRGHINVTKDGMACQHWNSQHPHMHSKDLTHNFPDDSLDAAGNYCRNPDNGDRPWCYHAIYTLPINRFGYCDVPMCPGYLSN